MIDSLETLLGPWLRRRYVLGAAAALALGTALLGAVAAESSTPSDTPPSPTIVPLPAPPARVSARSPAPARVAATLHIPAVPASAVQTDPAPGTRPAVRAGGWKVLEVRRGDTLGDVFQRAGLSYAQVQAVLRLGGPVRELVALRPGEKVRVRIGADGDLQELRYPLSAFDTLAVNDVHGALEARAIHVEPEHRQVLARGTVRSTLSEAMQRQGLDAGTIAAVTRIFRQRVNFRRDVHPGSDFSVLYQALYRDGRRIGTGDVLAAELDLAGRTLRAFRFADGDGQGHYYDQHGMSLARSLLRTPVHYTRISSRFSRHRYNPVLHVWRPHYGVDLAAPRGTPVEAAGDGVVTFCGRKGGYGNLVKLRHFGPYTTRYAHLLHFAKGLHRGEHVHQGQVIAYVGETGEATGPHLHFEIRVHGKARNPITMKLPHGVPLPRRERRRYLAHIRPLVAALEGQPQSDAVARVDQERPAAPQQVANAAAGQGTTKGG